jgi:hypothetical protein
VRDCQPGTAFSRSEAGEGPWSLSLLSGPKEFLSVQDQKDRLRRQLDDALRLFKCPPVLFNAHSGCDSWTEAQTLEFLDYACGLEREYGVR